MDNSKMVFKPRVLIYVIIFANLIPYTCLAFVYLSLSEPITIVFYTHYSRWYYLVYILCCLCLAIPYILPFEEQETK